MDENSENIIYLGPPENESDNLSPDDKNEEMTDISENSSVRKRKSAQAELGAIPRPSETDNPVWLSISEGAKIGGVSAKTVRRALQNQQLKYKIVGNRYFVDFFSLIAYLHSNTKLRNKLYEFGIGQYVKEWHVEAD